MTTGRMRTTSKTPEKTTSTTRVSESRQQTGAEADDDSEEEHRLSLAEQRAYYRDDFGPFDDEDDE